jgi:heterodisulfide reductase subunit D
VSQDSELGFGRFTFRQLMELDACTRCGECIPWCPTYAEKSDEPITPLGKIEALRRMGGRSYGLRARLFGRRTTPAAELAAHAAGVFDCTLCGRCHEVCPVRIDTRPLWLAMRAQLADAGSAPAPLSMVRDRIAGFHNISGEPNSGRSAWADNLDVRPPSIEAGVRTDTVLFVGCVASLYPMAYGIPGSMAGILSRAGVPFASMGGDEWCCGFPLIIGGMVDDAVALARHNVEAVRSAGARQLLTTCPSCYHTWKHTYPRLLGEEPGFAVLHSTQLLDALLRTRALQPGPFEARVTYHDPCDLGRTSGLYETPRRVLRAIPGLTLVEMAEHGRRALCCGGGGDVEMADPELTTAVARRRIGQARDVGAGVIASACQQCKRTLAGAARREKLRIRVLDVTEILWEALQSG